jgi:hypothetical protein
LHLYTIGDPKKEEVIGDAENDIMRRLTVSILFFQHSQENKMRRTCCTQAKWEIYTKFWLENEQLGVKK